MLLHHVCIELWDLRIELSMLTSEPCWVLLVLKTTLHVLSGPTLLVATTSVATIFISRETIIQLCWTNIDNTATLRRSSLADMVKRKHTLAVSIDQGHSSDFYTVSPITWGKKKKLEKRKRKCNREVEEKTNANFPRQMLLRLFWLRPNTAPTRIVRGHVWSTFFFFFYINFFYGLTQLLWEKNNTSIFGCAPLNSAVPAKLF